MKQIEEWRDIKGFEGLYQVSNLGKVRTVARKIIRRDGVPKTLPQKVRATFISGRGYEMFTASKDSKTKSLYIHKEVARAFLGEVPQTYRIDHIDNNPLNNTVTNLRICHHKDNIRCSRRSRNNTSGVTGVTFDRGRKRWVAQITVDYKNKFLGSSKNFEEAVVLRKKAETKYFGGYTPCNDEPTQSI